MSKEGERGLEHTLSQLSENKPLFLESSCISHRSVNQYYLMYCSPDDSLFHYEAIRAQDYVHNL